VAVEKSKDGERQRWKKRIGISPSLIPAHRWAELGLREEEEKTKAVTASFFPSF
jgi:hypothetical protein